MSAIKVLGQQRPSDTSALTIYSPPDNTSAELVQIWVCNTSSSAATWRMFLDDDGTTADESTALVWDQSISADLTDTRDMKIGMVNTDGTMKVRSSVGSALTFTLLGRE